MELSSTIKSAVNTAFAALGDLVQTATLTPKGVTGFNHETQQVISSNSTPVTADAIEYNRKINLEGQIVIDVVLKAWEVPNDKYLTITLGTETFRIAEFNTNGYSTEIVAKKEK